MRLLLTMISLWGRFFDAVFPYTSARLHHWVYFLSDANLNTLEHHSLIPSVLPLYLFLLGRVVELYIGRTAPPDQTHPAWPSVRSALCKWLLLYQAVNIISALAVVITTPGFLAKLMVALDLWFALVLTYTAKLSSCFLIDFSLDVVAAVVAVFSGNV